MKYETKKKLKKWLGIGGIILASVLLCALVGNLSGGFQNMNPKDWDISMRNENNIIPVDELKEKVKSEAGFTVTQKDGVLKLSGKNKTETEVSTEKDMSRRKSRLRMKYKSNVYRGISNQIVPKFRMGSWQGWACVI